MKSRIKSFYNYMDIPFDDLTQVITEEDLSDSVNNDIKTVLLQHRMYRDIDNIEKNDVVVLSLKSDFPKFNKNEITLNVGLGLFSKELEEQIVGKSVGSTFCVTADEKNVEVFIKSGKRLTVPELDDDFVKTLGIDGVGNVDEYNKYMREKFIEFFRVNYVSWYAVNLLSETFEKSEFEFDGEETEALFLAWHKKQQEEHEFHNTYMAENYEGEEEDMEREDSMSFIKYALVYCFFNGVDYRKFELDVNDENTMVKLREKAILPLEKYLNDKVKIVIGEEE